MLEHQTCFSLLALVMMKRTFPKKSGCAIICPSQSVGTFPKPVVLEWSAERVGPGERGGEQTFVCISAVMASCGILMADHSWSGFLGQRCQVSVHPELMFGGLSERLDAGSNLTAWR